jgi:membrane-associated phospholipid phosphatase
VIRPAPPPLNDARRVGAAFLSALFIAVLYEVPLRVHLIEPAPLQPGAIDTAIPFVQWTVWIYGSYFVFLFVPFAVCRDDDRAGRVFCALIANSVVAGAIFVAWPTSGTAQQPTMDGVSGLLWSALLFVDLPGNFLPSLHVANTCVCALALRREGSGWRIVGAMWAALIAISTLTTKQHFFIDVPAGAALGALSFWLFGGVPRRIATARKMPQLPHLPH